MVGLHGVGGLGKTTMCKIMVNYFSSQYPGRCHVIEFPSEYGDGKKIVIECKKALEILANLSHEHVLNKLDDFDQVVQLMEDHLSRHDVFLAIDNVWEKSREEAERILGVSFSANSKVLLTSRSDQVLKDLLDCHSNVGPLPALMHEEAFQIFQGTSKLGGVNSLVNENQIIDSAILERCRFSGDYHPLALKALGQHVKRVCTFYRSEQIGHQLSLIRKQISNKDMRNLDAVIRLSYENLRPEHKKHMFLDIAVWLMHDEGGLSYAKAHRWLSFLYQEFSDTTIAALISELASDGLIQLETDGRAEKMITVHDLFCDLAQREAASSSRFLTNGSTKMVEEIEWGRLERVILRGAGVKLYPRFIEKLLQQERPKLQVLYFRKGDDCMETLLSIEDFYGPTSWVLDLNGFVHLQMLHVEECGFLEAITGLDALKDLKRFYVGWCPCLENLDGLISGLIGLKDVVVESCKSLKKMPDLSGLTRLERLKLSDNRCMEEIMGGLSPALEHVSVEGCGAVKKMPDLRGLTCLEGLELRGNGCMEEIMGGLSPSLKHVIVEGCGALKKMPDLSGLTCLESLELSWNESLDEVGGQYLPTSLTELKIRYCTSLRSIPSWNECVHLRTLKASAHYYITSNGSSEKLENLVKRFTLLENLTVYEWDAIRLDVGGLTNLKSLEVSDSEVLEEIGDFSALQRLEGLSVHSCARLRRLVGLMAIKPQLQDLHLRECGSPPRESSLLRKGYTYNTRLRSAVHF